MSSLEEKQSSRSSTDVPTLPVPGIESPSYFPPQPGDVLYFGPFTWNVEHRFPGWAGMTQLAHGASKLFLAEDDLAMALRSYPNEVTLQRKGVTVLPELPPSEIGSVTVVVTGSAGHPQPPLQAETSAPTTSEQSEDHE